MPPLWKWPYRALGHCGRWPRPRDLVLDFLAKNSGHWSAKDIYASPYPCLPQISLATIYRTLDLLTRMGLLNRLTMSDGQNRYEFSGDPAEKHRHHLICTRCGCIMDTTDFVNEEKRLIQLMEEAIKERHRFSIQGHQMTFYGLCPACQQEKPE